MNQQIICGHSSMEGRDKSACLEQTCKTWQESHFDHVIRKSILIEEHIQF